LHIHTYIQTNLYSTKIVETNQRQGDSGKEFQVDGVETEKGREEK